MSTIAVSRSRLMLEQQVEDLRLHRHVERRGRLVGDERSGWHSSAMAIMTRWRMPPENSCGYWSMRRRGVGDAHALQHVDGTLRAAVSLRPSCAHQHLGHLAGRCEIRIERRHRVLEDHGDLAAADAVELAGAASPSRSCAAEAHAAAWRGRCAASSPMMARKTWLLPEPDSPTMPSVSPGSSAKLEAVARRAPRRRASRSGRCRSWTSRAPISSAVLRVERVAQAVADEVEAEQRHRQERAPGRPASTAPSRSAARRR